MVLWRISRHRDLSGVGGLKAAGRWQYAGQPVVYLAESPSAALWEVCVHTSANEVPPEFTLLRIEGPEVDIRVVNLEDLSAAWSTSLEETRDLGTEWLRGNKGVMLQVPSAIVPETANFLFNPLRPDAAKFRIAEVRSYRFDMRIKR